jgi:signal transduction histidine kinase
MRGFRSVPPIVVDTLMAVGLFFLGVENRAESADFLAGVFTRAPDNWNLLLIALQTLPLALRRRFPQAVLAVVLGAFVVDRYLDYPGTFAAAGLVLAFPAIGSELPPRRSLIVGFGLAALVTLYTAVGALTLESVDLGDVISTGLMVAVPVALGREVYQRRRRYEALEERAAGAEREHEERAKEAVREERARIARELHDVVAHQMAVMTLQAEGARRVVGESDARVAAALDTIRQTGHDALNEMRRMVGLLREAPAEGATGLAPQPGMGDLDRLVEQMREAGLDVSLERHGRERLLPSGIDLNAFRIVQESLTNAMKHGGPKVRATVAILYEDDRLELHITDDGGGGVRSSNGTGQGLVGMRERVAMLHGEFTAGPAAGGGFRVHATLPVNS